MSKAVKKGSQEVSEKSLPKTLSFFQICVPVTWPDSQLSAAASLPPQSGDGRGTALTWSVRDESSHMGDSSHMDWQR